MNNQNNKIKNKLIEYKIMMMFLKNKYMNNLIT